jgi:hypothetical protein
MTKKDTKKRKDVSITILVEQDTAQKLKKEAEKKTEGNLSVLIRSIIRGAIG